MRNSTLLRVANACFAMLLVLVAPVVAATAGNRSGDGTNQPNESPQISIANPNVLFPAQVDRPAITIDVSPFNALGRREMSEYQLIDLNVGPGRAARAGCIGDGCDETAPHVIPSAPSARALGKDKKCKDKNKEKPEEECEERDEGGCCIDEDGLDGCCIDEDGCCIDEDDGSTEAKNVRNGDVGSDSDEKETSGSDGKKQSGSDSDEDGKDDNTVQQGEEAREKIGAKEAKKKAKAKANAKKEDEEKKVDSDESSQSEEEGSKDETDDKPSDSENPNSDEVDKMLSDDNNAEKKKTSRNDESKDDASKDKAQSNGEKTEEKQTGGGNDSLKAKPSELSKDKASEPSKDNESKEFGVNEKKSDKVDIGESNKAKSKNANDIIVDPDKDLNNTDSKDGGLVEKDDAGKEMKKSATGADDGSDNRVDDHSPELKGSHQSSQPLQSKHPQSKLNSRPGLNKSPKDEKSANRVDTDPENGGDVLSFPRSQNRDDNRKSSKKSSSVSNRNSQPDLHSPGGSNGVGDNRGPIPSCLSNCGTKARASMKECKASIKARSHHNIEECSDLSDSIFDDCAHGCIQARGGGPGPNYLHDRPHWPRPGGGGNGHRPGGKPHHPGDRPRSTPAGGDESDLSRPRPEPDRPGRGDDADDGAANDCSAICWAENRRMTRRWCSSRSCPTWIDAYLQLCIRECQSTDDSGRDSSESDDSLDPLQSYIIMCKSSCKSNAQIKESWCNDTSKDKHKGLGISDDNCSNWADSLRLKCYDDCYENAKVVEGESIPKEEDDEKSPNNKSKNDAPAKQEPQKAKKKQRQDDISNAHDNTDFSSDRPWIDNKIKDPKALSQPMNGKEQERPPSNAGTSKPKPHPHPHLPGIKDDPLSSTQNVQQGSPEAASSSSNPVDISNNGVDIDSFTVNLSIALRSNEGLETIKVRSNSGSVRADQENLRKRLLIQDEVIRVLKHIMEEELGYHVRQEEWDSRVRQLRQRELVTLHHDIDQTTAHTTNLGATSRAGVAVKWIKFSVVYDIVDFLTNDHSSLITGLDVTVRSAGSSQASHLHPHDQQPHLLLTGWQIASAARAAVAGRIRDGTLLQLLRFRGVDALAVTDFGNEASVSFDQGWTDEMPSPSGYPDDTIPVTSIDTRTNATGQSWDASRLVGAGVFVLVFGLIVGSAQWAWNRRRQRREMEWTTAGAQEHFYNDNVVYEEWQTRLSPGEGTPSESGGSMVIDVANAIHYDDKISSLGIGTASEASVIGWRPHGGRYSRTPSNFSSIVHNAYDSVSPSDAALNLVGEEFDANSRGQFV